MNRLITHGVAALSAAALLAGAHGAAARDLIYGAGTPAKSSTMIEGPGYLLPILNKESKGEMNWKLLAGSQVVSLRSTLAGLRDGIIDAGFVVPVFTRKQLKHVNVLFDMQAFGEDPAVVSAAVTETMLFDCPDCIKDFAKYNALHLVSFANTSYNLICRDEVRTVADVKNWKIRTVGAGTRVVKALGAVPVSMSPPDATTALQRGGIDCVMGAVAWLRNFGYWDVAKYVLEYHLGSPRALGEVVIRRQTWDGLSLASKKLIIDNLPMMLSRLIYIGNIKADEEIKAGAIKKGIKFIKGGKDFADVMAKHTAGERAAIISVMKKQGVKNPGKIIDAFNKNLAKWQKLMVGKKNIPDYAKLLREHIFSRLDPAKL